MRSRDVPVRTDGSVHDDRGESSSRMRLPRPRIPLLSLGRYSASPDEAQWLTKGAILYTTCDEDSWSELAGLRVGPNDDVLSITGSGCRSLNLLLGGPRRLVSVDGNPLQNYLLELKIAGIRRYGQEDFSRLLGLWGGRDEGRLDLYEDIRGTMSPGARRFWDLNRPVVHRGVLFSGAHETFYRRFIGPAVRLLRPRRVRELFAFDDVSAQIAFWDRQWDHVGWRTAVRVLARPAAVRALLADPSYFLHVDRQPSMAEYLLGRLRSVHRTHLAKDNHLFTLIVYGRYRHAEAVPPYLSPTHYETIRKHIDAVEVVSERIDRYMARQADDAFTKFSLSDISGWTTPAEFAEVLRQVARTCRPGGRVVYRNFLTDRPLDPSVGDQLRHLPDASAQLTKTDIAFAFTLVVAEKIATRKEQMYDSAA